MKKPKGFTTLSSLIKKKAKMATTQNKEGGGSTTINFSVSKKLKNEFRAVCDEHSVNASEYMRDCMELFIKYRGDVKSILNRLKN